MARALIVIHGRFVAMFFPKLKFGMELSQGDGMEVTGGLVFRGLGGPKPPA
jgi:hypothetical protein